MQSPSITALITGASGGIGYELARVFAAEGYNLVLVARSGEQLRRVAEELSGSHGISVQTIVKDLSVPNAADEVFAALQGKTRVDVLVNNAGVAMYGVFLEADPGTELAMMNLNMIALTRLTRLFGADMAARKSGKILNVASTAAFQPGPLMAVYYATKAYVLSFSEALATELAPLGIGVSALCPGATHSGFQRRAKMERSKLFDMGVMDAATVARAGYRGLMKSRRVIIPGLRHKVFAVVAKLLPRRIVPYVVLQIQKPRRGRS